MATTLASYILDTRRLLHDSTGKYWTDNDLTAYINKGRNRTVADTSCYRVLQTIYLSQNLELYSYGGVTGATVTNGGSGYSSNFVVNFTGGGGTGATGMAIVASGAVSQIYCTATGSGYTSAPTVDLSLGGGIGATATSSIINPNTMDVVNLTVLWGSLRIILDRMSYTQFQSTVRAWQAFNQRPTTWASYGQSAVYVGPIPDQFYQAEFDTVMNPTDLVSGTDVETQISTNFQPPVPFYAAHWAKFQQQDYTEAEMFKKLYDRKVQEVLRSVMLRKLPSAYGM